MPTVMGLLRFKLIEQLAPLQLNLMLYPSTSDAPAGAVVSAGKAVLMLMMTYDWREDRLVMLNRKVLAYPL